MKKDKYVARCAIWYQTLKNGVLTVGQNAVLTSQSALERHVRKAFLSIRLYGIQTLICLTIRMACTWR